MTTDLTIKLNAAPATPVAADVVNWIAYDEAARLLGLNVNHVRRLCGEQLAAQGLAVKARPTEGGQAKWFIARRYDLRLAPGVVGAQYQLPVAELERVPETQRSIAFQRAACVDALKAARSTWDGRQGDWLPRLIDRLRLLYPKLSISRTSLLRWYDLYRSTADIIRLVDRRGGNTRGDADPAAWKIFGDYFLDDRQPSIRDCWQRTKDDAASQKLKWVSYKACTRQLDERVPPELQARHRKPVVYRQRFSPFIEQDPESWAPGHCWIGDHTQLDLWCWHRQSIIRPWLTTWMDWRSRRIVGAVLCASPSSSTILAAFRLGMLDQGNMGGPGVVWIDNGRDYDARTFHGQTKKERRARVLSKGYMDEATIGGLYKLLSVDAHFSLAYNPNGKARIERWFGTLHDQFDRTFPTYCGASPDQRPESLDEVLGKPQMIPSFDHVMGRCWEHIAGYNADANHTREDMLGVSADDVMQQAPTRRVLADPASLDLLLQHWEKPVTVGRNGITISPRGIRISYGQYDESLRRFKGTRREDRQQLRVSFDPEDVKTIRVYTMDWRHVCDATMNEIGGLHDGTPASIETVGRLNREKNAYNRAGKVRRENRHFEYQSLPELIAQEAAKDRKPHLPQPSEQSLRVVQTPVDGQSKAIISRPRKAAGAETYNDLDILDELTAPIAGDLAAGRMNRDHLADGGVLDFQSGPPATFAGDAGRDTDDSLDFSGTGTPPATDAGDSADLLDEIP